MIIFPAIDLRRGRVVRLRQGRPDAETVYEDDPVRAARRWVDAGATWLHVVNLDGALGNAGGGEPRSKLPAAHTALESILASVPARVQFGGGIRSLEDMARVLSLGVERVILGTLAVEQPDVVRDAVSRFGAERIVVGLDARDGRVATHGWTNVSDVDVITLGKAMRQAGLRRALYTDIARDGMLSGVNVDATAQLAAETGLRTIASGGVASIHDVQNLKAVEQHGVEGVIIGQALYGGALDLREALKVAHGA